MATHTQETTLELLKRLTIEMNMRAIEAKSPEPLEKGDLDGFPVLIKIKTPDQ